MVLGGGDGVLVRLIREEFLEAVFTGALFGVDDEGCAEGCVEGLDLLFVGAGDEELALASLAPTNNKSNPSTHPSAHPSSSTPNKAPVNTASRNSSLINRTNTPSPPPRTISATNSPSRNGPQNKTLQKKSSLSALASNGIENASNRLSGWFKTGSSVLSNAFTNINNMISDASTSDTSNNASTSTADKRASAPPRMNRTTSARIQQKLAESNEHTPIIKSSSNRNKPIRTVSSQPRLRKKISMASTASSTASSTATSTTHNDEKSTTATTPTKSEVPSTSPIKDTAETTKTTPQPATTSPTKDTDETTETVPPPATDSTENAN